MNTSLDRKNLLRIMDAMLDAGGARDAMLAESGVPPPPNVCTQPWNRLILVTGGSLRVNLVLDGRNTVITKQPGQAIFYPPLCWSQHLFPATVQLFGIVFREGYLRYVYSDKRSTRAGMRQSGYRYHTSGPLSAQARHVLNALQQLAESRGDTTTGCLLFNALLRFCRAELAADVPSSPDRARQTFQLVCDYLQDHYLERINRDSVAKSLQLHPNYLSRLFKSQSGETLIRHLRALRLREAATLLGDDKLKIDDVAARSGFGDLPHFFRVFHDTYGMSPTQYRQRAAMTDKTPPEQRQPAS